VFGIVNDFKKGVLRQMKKTKIWLDGDSSFERLESLPVVSQQDATEAFPDQ